MRVLFYLPGITDRHFGGVVLPLIRHMTTVAEVHVMGPPEWEKTGLTEKQLMHCVDMPGIQWHILDGEGHERLRTAPGDPDALVDYVRDIAPDYTFCRGADVATPSRFPGQTRFMMEPIIPPFRLKPEVHGGMILDGPGLYDQGFMPDLTEDQLARLDALSRPAWDGARARYAAPPGAREAYFGAAGLPLDRKVILLPLNAEASNNFFVHQHSLFPSNVRLVETLAEQLEDDVVLALTQHPLNLRGNPEVDLSVEPIEPVVARLGDRVRLVTAPGPAGNATATLMRHCDGAIICESKSFGFAAFFGTPVLRLSRFASAPWMHAYGDLAAFLADIRTGAARGADEAAARRFLAFHYANDVFASYDPALTPEEILARVDRPVDPERWAQGLDRVTF
ncbi:MAG: hypothetical protein J7494_01920 [Sphingobium sp.]|nr:hypothetical protein [Sphingobium sp.]